MTYWIIGGNGQTFGPVDLATIHRWVAERRVISTTPVGHSATGPWRDAALFPEFASAFGAEPMQDAAPAEAAHRAAPPTGPTPSSAAVPTNWPPDMIAIPQLISGIFNIVAAVSWAFTCFGIILSIPLMILGVYELIAYSRARTTDPAVYLESTKTKAILDICTILTGNFASLVCGILMLTQIPAARERLAAQR
jgi:hypothetical protein